MGYTELLEAADRLRTARDETERLAAERELDRAAKCHLEEHEMECKRSRMPWEVPA